jgi:hypothetical protein
VAEKKDAPSVPGIKARTINYYLADASSAILIIIAVVMIGVGGPSR